MKQKKKINWVEFGKASLVVLCALVTVCFTWGLPQLFSYGASNFPSIPLDNSIPLVTEFVWVYYFTFPLAIFTIYVLYYTNREAMFEIVIAFMLSCFISMIFYFCYPTEMIKPALDPVTFSDKFTIATWNASRPVCCLPSQHCFMALSCIIASFHEKKIHISVRIFTFVCGILIICSTVLIKQHYLLDAIASLCILVPIFFIFKLLNLGKKCDKIIFKEKN